MTHSSPEGPTGGSRVLVLVALMFGTTGVTSLVGEQAFEKLLGTLLGTSTPAATIVLAVYFAGFTLGALLYAPFLRPRVGNPLRAYALLEGGVAVWALLLNVVFPALIGFFTPVLSLGREHLAVLQTLRFLVAVVWILPPTTLMGATFPAIVDALERLEIREIGRTMAAFYSVNLMGAILGAGLAPYLIFPTVGLSGALALVTGANTMVAASALWLSHARLGGLPIASGPFVSTQPQAIGAGRLPRIVAVIAFLSGLLFFGLEVTWIHLNTTVLGNSVYSFAIMLTVVLAGLGIGSWGASRIAPGRLLSAAVPACLLLVAGATLAVAHSRWPRVPETFSRWGSGLTTFSQGELLRWLQATIQILPTASVLGAVYPVLFRLDVFPGSDRSAAVGRITALNCVGCILGALATGFGAIPLLGSEATLLLAALLYSLCGLLLLLLSSSTFLRRAGILGAGVVIAFVVTRPPWNRLALTSGENVYFRRAFVSPLSRLLFFHEDTAGGITTVVARTNPNGVERTLLTNGKFQGSDGAEVDAQTAFALIPSLFVSRAERALVIGLGTGHTAGVIEALGFRKIDIAEIAPGIVAARYSFADINGGILEKPHVTLHLEDGRNFLLLRPDRYDLITTELTSVWFAGATNLYSREFYQLARQRLARGGVFQQWIQFHHIGLKEVECVISTLADVFPHVSVWYFGAQAILVASDTEQALQPAALDRLMERSDRIRWPRANVIARFRGVISSRLLAPEDTSRLSQAARAIRNTDRNRYLEYATPRYNLSRLDHPALNIAGLLPWATFPAFRVAGPTRNALAVEAVSIDRDEMLRVLGVAPRPGRPARLER
jgi:spermidine synthase